MSERSDRWALIDGIFCEVLEMPPEERGAFLTARCAGDGGLREEVLALLAASEDEGFLPDDADTGSLRAMVRDAAGGAFSGSTDKDPLIGETLGAFRVLRVLGRGGMGTVYLAERVEGFEQRVALKTLRRGVDTDEVVQRFLAERQILAQLDHPNIASLFDGGSTPDGRPYFVMEFVQGRPITEYADAEQLGIAARLDLLKTVAGAIHHAHQNLVVHRDLKPSNVFVTHDGVVKLLDFGIARLIGSEHRWGQTRTSTGFRILTPAYAAPEQVARGPVTTATDVYQLGALFYELVTGVRPFPSELSEPELEERILTRDPEALSKAAGRADVKAVKSRGFSSNRAFAHTLEGDLDVIGATALAKEPARRYGSVAAMAEDVQRHLAGRPISARPPSVRYHLGRFARRNPWFLPACAAGAAALALYVGTAQRHNRQLTAERDRAEAVTSFVTNLFNSPNPWEGGVGADVTVLEALEAGAQRAEIEFGDRPEIQARLLEVIGTSYFGLNRTDEAYALQSKALALRESLEGPEAIEALNARHMLGITADIKHGVDSALAHLLPVADALESRTDPTAQRLHAEVLGSIADSYWRASDFDNALKFFERTDAAFSSLDPPALAAQGKVLRRYGRAHGQSGRDSDGTEQVLIAQRAVQLLEAALPADHIELAAARQDVGSAYSNVGRYEESVEQLERALTVFEDQLEPNDSNALSVRSNIAYTLWSGGRLDEAETAFRENIRRRELIPGKPDRGLAGDVQNLAVVVSDLGRSDEAVELGLRAHELFEQILGEHYLTAFPLLTIARIELDQEQFATALGHAAEAFELLSNTLPEGHFATATALCRRGQARMGTGRLSEGVADLEAALELLHEAPVASAEEYVTECTAALNRARTPAN